MSRRGFIAAIMALPLLRLLPKRQEHIVVRGSSFTANYTIVSWGRVYRNSTSRPLTLRIVHPASYTTGPAYSANGFIERFPA